MRPRYPRRPACGVYSLVKGINSQFLQSFQDQQIGFLDFPGFDLPESNLMQVDDLIPRIARSQKIRELLRENPENQVELNLNDVSENMVSLALSQTLRHEHPFTLLERSRFIETFALFYGSFVFDDRHVSTIYNDSSVFLDADAALLGAISRLSAAACHDRERGTLYSNAVGQIWFRLCGAA